MLRAITLPSSLRLLAPCDRILRLEAANLVRSARDEDDKRRKSIIVTSNGWFVKFARENFSGTLFEKMLGHDTAEDLEPDPRAGPPGGA